MQKILFNTEINALIISYSATEGTSIQVLKQIEGEQDEVLETESISAVKEYNDFINTLKAKYNK